MVAGLMNDRGLPISGVRLQDELERQISSAVIRDCGHLVEALHHGRRRSTRRGYYVRGKGR